MADGNANAQATTIRTNAVAERAVIGGVMVHPESLPLVQPIISADDFYWPSHAAIWRAIMQLGARKQPIDETTIGEELRSVARENVVRDHVSFEELRFYAAKRVEHVEAHARIVADNAIARRLTRELQRAQLKVEDPSATIDELVATARSIPGVCERREEKPPKTMEDCAREFWTRYIEHPNEHVTGLSSGLRDLDDVTAGWQPGQLVIVAARPAMGKSALAMAFGMHCAERLGQTSLLFTPEMTAFEVFTRMACNRAEVDSKTIARGQMTGEQRDRISSIMQELVDMPMVIDDDGRITVPDIRARAIRQRESSALGLILVDYLTKVRPPRGQRRDRGREQEVSEIASELKAIAKELNVPVIALAQLNRDCEDRPDKRPLLSDLRESGSIEQEADVVLLLYRDEYYKRDSLDAGIAEIAVAKQRNGATAIVPVAFSPTLTRFSDLADADRLAFWERKNKPTKPERAPRPTKQNEYNKRVYGDRSGAHE